jgi:putrescine aminotransferase
VATRLTLSDEDIDRLTALDGAHFFHAATPLQQHEKDGPRIFVGGEGIYLYVAKGRAFIDGLASPWNVNCGHGRQDIVDAITGQMRQLAFSTSFPASPIRPGSSSRPAWPASRPRRRRRRWTTPPTS